MVEKDLSSPPMGDDSNVTYYPEAGLGVVVPPPTSSSTGPSSATTGGGGGRGSNRAAADDDDWKARAAASAHRRGRLRPGGTGRGGATASGGGGRRGRNGAAATNVDWKARAAAAGRPRAGRSRHATGATTEEEDRMRPGAFAVSGIGAETTTPRAGRREASSSSSFSVTLPRDDDDGAALPAAGASSPPPTTTPPQPYDEIVTTATLVREEEGGFGGAEEIELVVAEKMPSERLMGAGEGGVKSCLVSFLADRRVRFSLVVLCLTVVAAAIGAGVAVGAGGGGDDGDQLGGPVGPTVPPHSAPPSASPRPSWDSTLPPSLSPTYAPTSSPTRLSWEALGSDLLAPVGSFLFGYDVSLSRDGSRLAVGAPGGFNGGTARVHVYQYNGTSWESVGNPIGRDGEEDDVDDALFHTGPDTANSNVGEGYSDRTGRATCLNGDGTILAVGTPGADDGTNVDAGRIQVYSWTGSSWAPRGGPVYGEDADDRIGFDAASLSVSDDGNRMAIGSGRNDGGTSSADARGGHVRVYEYDEAEGSASGGDWKQLGFDIDGVAAGDFAGFAVELSGDGQCIAVGAPESDGGGEMNSGHVRVFKYDDVDEDWRLLGRALNGTGNSARAGYSVSMPHACSHVAFSSDVSSQSASGRGGAVDVYAYNEDDDEWIPMGDSIRGVSYERLGFSLSLSSDATRIAAGAPYREGQKGYVHVYRFNGTAWLRMGETLDQDSANLSGFVVSMSGDGRRVAFGSPDDFSIDSFSTATGEARVFELRDS